MKSVLIIVLNWNGEEYLEECLESIRENTDYGDYDTVVVDNDSSDGSRRVVYNFEEADLIRNSKNYGFSIGNNTALDEREGYDYYLLLNNDTHVKENWLSNLVDTAEKNHAGITGPKLFYGDGEVIYSGAELRVSDSGEDPLKVAKDYENDEEVTDVPGACMLISNDVIDEIGFLDECFSPAYYEDKDYCKRAKEAGFDLYFSAASEVIHYAGKAKEEKPSNFNYFVERKNRIKYIIMNVPVRKFHIAFKKELKHLGAAILGYKHNSIKQLLKAYKEVVVDLPGLLNKRMKRKEFLDSYFISGKKDFSSRYR